MATLTENIANVLIQIGLDIKNLIKIPAPTEEGQVLTAKMVDGALQPVWVSSTPPVPFFDDLINCTYDGQKLNYTSGAVAALGTSGYEASSSNPKNFAVTKLGQQYPMYIFIGDNQEDVNAYYDGNAEGILICFESSQTTLTIKEESQSTQIDFANNEGDTLNITLLNGCVTITNTITGGTWTSPHSTYLDNPKYMGVLVGSTEPLSIKAI